MDRAAIVHENFLRRASAGDLPDGLAPIDAVPETMMRLYRSQCLSRQLDQTSRNMQKADQGYYTIGSRGHVGMAAAAEALRPTDMAFLHYRDAAFQIARAAQVPGHAKLAGDAIVMCSLGDVSANHSTAQGAINTACWTSYQSVPLPLLFVCEDNGIGISTPTRDGWIAENFSRRSGLKYFICDGLDLAETLRVSQEAAAFVRSRRKPAFLHVRMVRLYGHAGSDVGLSYRAKAAVEADEANDPLLHSVRVLRGLNACTPRDALDIYDQTGADLKRIAAQVVKRTQLKTASQVAASVIPPPRPCASTNGPSDGNRNSVFGTDLRAMAEPQPMVRLIGWALNSLMLDHPEVVIAGEDVGRKGGVYGVTQKLQSRFGPDRVIDTLLDEQSILGLAIGLGHNRFVPIPDPQKRIPLGEIGVDGDGTDLAIVTYGNGRYLSTQAAQRLACDGINIRVIDMCWLAPLPETALLEATKTCASILIVDECRKTGSQSEALMALFTKAGRQNVALVTAENCFIATGPAYAATLPSTDGNIAATRSLKGRMT